MHNQDQRDYAEQSIPFRESETKTAIIKSKLRDRQAVGYVLNSKQLMEEMKNKLQGQEIVREVEEYMASYSILSQTKNTRKDVERETRKMKEICVEVSSAQ
jgi:predicted nuclease with TOPRIM domain